MFVSLRSIKRPPRLIGAPPPANYSYELTDTCWSEIITSPSIYQWNSSTAIAIIKQYERRNLYAISNLARYYRTLNRSNVDVNRVIIGYHFKEIDKLDKQVQYAKRYYPLLRNHYLSEFFHQNGWAR